MHDAIEHYYRISKGQSVHINNWMHSLENYTECNFIRLFTFWFYLYNILEMMKLMENRLVIIKVEERKRRKRIGFGYKTAA